LNCQSFVKDEKTLCALRTALQIIGEAAPKFQMLKTNTDHIPEADDSL